MKGSVYAIYRDRGFGYIQVSGQDYWFHRNDLINSSWFQLEEGDAVEFQTEPGKYGRPKAKNVRKVYQASEESTQVSPGIHPGVKLYLFNEDENKIIKKLSTCFYVTKGGESFTLGKSTYKYCLIKPTDYFTKAFQLKRELVVIFCDYVSFEQRSLEAASIVYKNIEYKLRLDRGCYVLISHDNSTEEKIAQNLKDTNLNQIVVPFTYSELLSDKSSIRSIQDRFTKYLFDVDLFPESAPIRNDVFFFGRRDYVHDIVSKCRNGVHSGIFGLRRSGKTSMLYAVQRLLNEQKYMTVFIPCESELSNLNWQSALCKVVLDVYSVLGLSTKEIREDDYLSENTTTYFEEDMFAALQYYSNPITLMFDEIEAITFSVIQGEESPSKWIDGINFSKFWNTIKGYSSKYPGQLSILVAGTNPAINEVPTISINNVSNPMFKQLSESNQGAYLPPFTVDDTKKMVNTLGGYMGMSFDDYSVGKLTIDCGGHPYLMRILCSYIYKYVREKALTRPVVVSKSIYDKAIPEFEKSNDANSFFMMILNILMTSYPKEYNTLKELAINGDSIVSQIQDKSSLFHLIGYGLVECNQNNYAIKYNTITNFLKGLYRFERTGLTIEEQKEEIQTRINRAEIKLRTIVKNALLWANGEKKAKNLVIKAMMDNNAINGSDVVRAESLNYVQLFDPSLNKIYFSLLKRIITNNINCFSNIEAFQDIEAVKQNLETINQSRRCPDHSYTENSQNWSWEKFLAFRNSIKWLEDALALFD